MIWIYRLLFLPIFLLFSPFYFVHIWRRGGYGRHFRQRLGFFPLLPPRPAGTKRLWIHVVSVGEAQSIGPLVKRLIQEGCWQIVITTTTSTGYQTIESRYANEASVGLFPFDFWPFSSRAWRRIQPDLALLVDSELWPEHLHQARNRNVPLLVINARLSDRSYNRLRRLKPLARWFWNCPTKILASGKETRQRLLDLGVFSGKIVLTGNLKCDRGQIEPLTREDRTRLLTELGLVSETDPLILFGCSTWPGEEKFLISVWKRLFAEDRRWKLILTPRHAERRQEIVHLLESENVAYHQRSKGKATTPGDVALVDTTGELSSLIRLGTITFLGKSLPPNVGGQTPIDGIDAGVPIVSGPAMTNFREMVEELQNCGGYFRLEGEEQIAQKILQLARDENLRRETAIRALEWLDSSRGALNRTLDWIKTVALGEIENKV